MTGYGGEGGGGRQRGGIERFDCMNNIYSEISDSGSLSALHNPTVGSNEIWCVSSQHEVYRRVGEDGGWKRMDMKLAQVEY